ncbi:MAG: hypothetical protein GTN76_00800 [Candidatus Aenigmarchaeota archaeon]|nr:hypothetical protein [Candidatus Aenigmarchaeota archaeon]
MSKARIIIFCAFFVLVGLLEIASSADLVKVNHFKYFKGGSQASEFLEVSLVTTELTRVQIVVTKLDEILQNHRLLVGPKGVVGGKFQGAQSWGYRLTKGIQGEDLEVAIFVQPLAGRGAPICYIIRSSSGIDADGFHSVPLGC